MKLLFENWREFINEAEQDDALELAAANLRQMFNLVKQVEKAHDKAPEKHTDLENIKQCNCSICIRKGAKMALINIVELIVLIYLYYR